MAITIEVGFFFIVLLLVFLYLGYFHKNAFLILASSIIFFVMAAMIWNGGFVRSVGSTINVSGTNYTTTINYQAYSFGFSQNILASLFGILGLFFLIQGFAAFTRSDNPGDV